MPNLIEELKTQVINLYAQKMREGGCEIPEDELRDSIRLLWDSGEFELVDGLDEHGNYAVQLVERKREPDPGE